MLPYRGWTAGVLILPPRPEIGFVSHFSFTQYAARSTQYELIGFVSQKRLIIDPSTALRTPGLRPGDWLCFANSFPHLLIYSSTHQLIYWLCFTFFLYAIRSTHHAIRESPPNRTNMHDLTENLLNCMLTLYGKSLCRRE